MLNYVTIKRHCQNINVARNNLDGIDTFKETHNYTNLLWYKLNQNLHNYLHGFKFYAGEGQTVKKCVQLAWQLENSIKNSSQFAKVGIRNLSPHLRNSAILRTTKTSAELRTKKKLRNCDCGPWKFDFCNSSTFRSLLPVRYFLVPFPQLRLVLKVKKNYL
jgi:hypothetical protein